jgi:CheY-like chemotaxis protein
MPDESRPGVLVVDDDDLIREPLGSSLRRHGFAVWLAGSGEQAVAVYREYAADIAVVVLDVKMPGMDGPATLVALRILNPQVRCCFISGYIEGYSHQELRALGADCFFLKPFSTAEVTQALWKIVGRPQGGY